MGHGSGRKALGPDRTTPAAADRRDGLLDHDFPLLPGAVLGEAMGNQLGLVLAGFAPMIAGMLLVPGVTGWVPVAIFATVCMLIAAAFRSSAVSRLKPGSCRPDPFGCGKSRFSIRFSSR